MCCEPLLILIFLPGQLRFHIHSRGHCTSSPFSPVSTCTVPQAQPRGAHKMAAHSTPTGRNLGDSWCHPATPPSQSLPEAGSGPGPLQTPPLSASADNLLDISLATEAPFIKGLFILHTTNGPTHTLPSSLFA